MYMYYMYFSLSLSLSLSLQPNYTKISEYCNLWRNYDDIEVYTPSGMYVHVTCNIIVP